MVCVVLKEAQGAVMVAAQNSANAFSAATLAGATSVVVVYIQVFGAATYFASPIYGLLVPFL